MVGNVRKAIITTSIIVLPLISSEESAQADGEEDIQPIIEEKDTVLINKVDKYISRISSGKSRLSGDSVVRLCNEYSFDIALLLAQGQIESRFGISGRARYTNSVFNVGAFDDGRNIYYFNDPNESIEHYILLIKEKYLVNRAVDDLLGYGCFVNVNGNRYARDKNYECTIRDQRRYIIRKLDLN